MIHDHINMAVAANAASSVTGAAIFAISDALSISVIGGVVSMVTGVATVYFAYKAKRFSEESKVSSGEAKTVAAEARDVSVATGKAVNGKMEEFKRMAEAFFHAKGVADEKVAAELKAGVIDKAKAEAKVELQAHMVPAPVAANAPQSGVGPHEVLAAANEARQLVGEAEDLVTFQASRA